MLVVAYDVPDNRRRRRLHEQLLDLGLPVQYSVFEIPDRNYRAVLDVLDAEAKPADAVRIYRLCRRCGDRVEIVGVGVAPTNEPSPPAVIEVPPGAPEGASGSTKRRTGRVRKVAPGPLEQGRMRSPSRLMAIACAMANLNEAFLDVKASRGYAGADGMSIAAFDRSRADRLAALQTQLLDGTYRPQPLRYVGIPKGGGSMRALHIPAVRDRVAQQAVLRVIAPLWDRELEECSFAYRRGRSVRSAVAAVERARDAGRIWVLKADIEHFFDEVDRELAVQRFRELVADDSLVALVTRWVRTPVNGRASTATGEKGLPQGASISPLMSNIYLDEFDEAMIRLGYRLVRYADDFVVLCLSREEAAEARADVARLLGESRLRLNDEKTTVTSFAESFRFLGYLFVGDWAIRAAKIPPSVGVTALRR
jgi:group II intron reverse transcriptase/maturase/CRISPR-associated endonuclease Cas2